MQMKLRSKEPDKQKKFHFDNLYMDNPKSYESIVLYQIGDLSCDGGYVIGDHIQQCYEISYIVSGCGHYYTDGYSYPVKDGDVYLSLPGELHNGIADKIDPFRYFYVGFNFDTAFNEDNSLSHIRKMFELKNKPVESDKFNIRYPFLNIFNELINLKDYSTRMISAYLQEIIILTYRNFFDNWEKEYESQDSLDETKQIVYEIVNYIDVNLFKIKELTQLANEMGYSYSHLSHIFSKEIGLTIKEYYNNKRFEKAVELLKDSNMSVTKISEELQYQSIHTFSKAFRKNFGISPTEYQALYKNHKK